MTIPEFLKKNDMTQIEFAKIIDRHPVTLNRIINGESIADGETVKRIFEVSNGEITPSEVVSVPK